jgi:hypothetical protein
MSTAVIIKNTILVILIILIGHFMVKNILLERPVSTKVDNTKISNNTPTINDVSPNVDVKKLEVLVGHNPVVETPSGIQSSSVTVKVQGGLDKAKEELLRFINDDEDDIEKFFGKETSLSHAPHDNCKSKTQETALRLSTTCDPALQDFNVVDKDTKNVQPITQCMKDSKNVMILKEYENESIMNGRALFGGLSAFDSFDNNFQLYSA